MCASGVGRKFEVKWNGVGELDLSEILKAKKGLYLCLHLKKKVWRGAKKSPPKTSVPTPMCARCKFSFVALGELTRKIF